MYLHRVIANQVQKPDRRVQRSQVEQCGSVPRAWNWQESLNIMSKQQTATTIKIYDVLFAFCNTLLSTFPAFPPSVDQHRPLPSSYLPLDLITCICSWVSWYQCFLFHGILISRKKSAVQWGALFRIQWRCQQFMRAKGTLNMTWSQAHCTTTITNVFTCLATMAQ